jgi:hypothetical protein
MITYRAINTTNGRFYIGSSRSVETFEKRKRSHLNYGEALHFQRELRKNPDVFIWETFEDDFEEPVLEQALLDMWFGKQQCYNLSPEASRPPSLSGDQHPMYGRRGKESPIFGRVWWVKLDGSEETHSFKQPGEDWVKGRKQVSASTRNKQSIQRKGRKQTTEHKEKIGKSREGKFWWVNENNELKFQKESPGPGWIRGKKWSSP